VPAVMLNEQGEQGWRMCGIAIRETRQPEPEGQRRWIFYFVREAEVNSSESEALLKEITPDLDNNELKKAVGLPEELIDDK
jgi:hypothetical protein